MLRGDRHEVGGGADPGDVLVDYPHDATLRPLPVGSGGVFADRSSAWSARPTWRRTRERHPVAVSRWLMTAWADASRAMGTRNGEHET